MVTADGRRWPPRWLLLFFFLLCSTCSCPPPPSPSPSPSPSPFSSSSSSSSSGRRIGCRRPKRSQPKSRICLVKRARIRRGDELGFECKERVSASAVVALALPESARRSSRSLRSSLEEWRQSRQGAVRARRESDHENVSMSFPRWRWSKTGTQPIHPCDSLSETVFT
jgi:hypothetical protein